MRAVGYRLFTTEGPAFKLAQSRKSDCEKHIRFSRLDFAIASASERTAQGTSNSNRSLSSMGSIGPAMGFDRFETASFEIIGFQAVDMDVTVIGDVIFGGMFKQYRPGSRLVSSIK